MIDGLEPYPETKESGVPWLGRVPGHWKKRRAKWLFEKMSRPVRPEDEVVTCFRDGEVTLRRKRRMTGFTESIKEIGYQGIREGDLVIHAMDAFAGAIGVSDSDGKSTPVYSVCASRGSEANPYFYAYAVREMARSQWIHALAKGIRERSTDFRFEAFARQELPLPPAEEQEEIVRFLDHADRRIRRYVRAKERLVDLLEEQKRAVIHRAVTRGLDPDVEMKESGVEWLGEVPAHWEVTRLLSLTNPNRPIMYGIVLPGPDVSDGVPIIKGGNCEPGKLQLDLMSRTSREIESRYVRSRVRSQDLVISIRGGVGATQVVPAELEGANLTQDAARIAPKAGVDPHWLCLYLRSAVAQAHLRARVVGATVQGINIRSLKRIPVVLPPTTEQRDLQGYLLRLESEIEATAMKARSETRLLKELRTRLIADVVTGKLDVRGAARRLPEELDG